MPDTPSTSSFTLAKRIFASYMQPHLSALFKAFFCMVISGLATALHAWLIKPVLDGIFIAQNGLLLYYIPIIIVVLSLILGVADYFQTIIMKSMGQKVLTHMQITLYAHLLHADMAFILQESSAKLISRLTSDIQLMRRSITSVFTGFVKEGVTLIALIGLMIYHSAFLTFLAFCVFPVAIYPLIKLGKKMRKVTNHTQESLGKFACQLDETFQGIKVVRAYGKEECETNRARVIGEKICNLYIKAAKIESLSSPMMELLGGVAIALVIFYGGGKVMEGTTTAGTFFSFITALIMAYKPLKSLSNLNSILQEGLASASRIFHLLDMQARVISSKNASKLTVKKGHIKCNNVSFSYNNEKKIFNKFNVEIEPGSIIGIVGPSGAGKSTLFTLLLRFYDPQEGTIYIDGQNIQEVTLESLRSQISYVSQEVFLFDDSVAANIAYGKAEATREEIKKAASQAEAHHFIMQLPHGYDTIIGPHGFTLSGGQRQRISIARALLRPTPLLLLDEATSALDSASEQAIQTALKRLMKDKTSIIIAHRFSTLYHADSIYVLDDGAIVEKGNHQELMQLEGLYYSLYKKQLLSDDR